MDFEAIPGMENVILIEDDNSIENREQKTFTTGELFEILKRHWVGSAFHQNSQDSWLVKGVKCKLLKPGDNRWMSGRVRITASIEFLPDESEVIEHPRWS
jgi:hypothetical protein